MSMIPAEGTVRIRPFGKDYTEPCQVIGAGEGDFLVARETMAPDTSFRVDIEWADSIGDVESFTPPGRVIPAAPGWWARYVWLDEETGQIEPELVPIVGWDSGKSLVVDFEDGGVICIDEIRTSDGIYDALIYDPEYRPEHPPINESRLRDHVKREDERLAEARRRAEERRAAKDGAAS